MSSTRRAHLKKLQQAYLAKQRASRRGKYTRVLAWQKEVQEQYPKDLYTVKVEGEQATISPGPRMVHALQKTEQVEYREQLARGQLRPPERVVRAGQKIQEMEHRELLERGWVPTEAGYVRYEPLSPRQTHALQKLTQMEQIMPREKRVGIRDIMPFATTGRLSEARSLAQFFGKTVRVEEGYYRLPSLTQPIGTKPTFPYAELRETLDIPEIKPATTPLELRRQEHQLRQFIGPQLISLKKAKVKRLSEELYARGDPFGFFASGFVSAGETTMELVFPHPTGVTPVHHDIFALPGQPPEFIVGRVSGEVVTAVILGKVFEGPLTVVTETIKKVGSKVVPQVVKTWVKTGTVAKTATAIKTKLPTIKGSRIDVWLTKHSKWYYKKTGGIAVQEVVQPAGVRVFDTATGKVVERVGTGYLTSSQLAWALVGTKRTSGISISKLFVEPLKKPSLKHLFYRGGKLTVGYLSELGFKKTAIETVAEQRALTPIVTQTQITRMGIIPTIGKLPTTTTVGKAILQHSAIAFGISLGAKLRLKPKLEPLEWQPTLARERVKFSPISLEKVEQRQKQLLVFPKLQRLQLRHQPLRQIYRPKLEKKEALAVPSLALPTMVMTKQEQKQLTIIKPIQIPKYVEPPKLVLPPPIPPIIPPLRTPVGGADVSRDPKGLFGRFFKREHPIKTAREMWETFSGKKKRKAKSKGRRRKRRRK